jgi:hypothetical protein
MGAAGSSRVGNALADGGHFGYECRVHHDLSAEALAAAVAAAREESFAQLQSIPLGPFPPRSHRGHPGHITLTPGSLVDIADRFVFGDNCPRSVVLLNMRRLGGSSEISEVDERLSDDAVVLAPRFPLVDSSKSDYFLVDVVTWTVGDTGATNTLRSILEWMCGRYSRLVIGAFPVDRVDYRGVLVAEHLAEDFDEVVIAFEWRETRDLQVGYRRSESTADRGSFKQRRYVIAIAGASDGNPVQLVFYRLPDADSVQRELWEMFRVPVCFLDGGITAQGVLDKSEGYLYMLGDGKVFHFEDEDNQTFDFLLPRSLKEGPLGAFLAASHYHWARDGVSVQPGRHGRFQVRRPQGTSFTFKYEGSTTFRILLPPQARGSEAAAALAKILKCPKHFVKVADAQGHALNGQRILERVGTQLFVKLVSTTIFFRCGREELTIESSRPLTIGDVDHTIRQEFRIAPDECIEFSHHHGLVMDNQELALLESGESCPINVGCGRDVEPPKPAQNFWEFYMNDSTTHVIFTFELALGATDVDILVMIVNRFQFAKPFTVKLGEVPIGVDTCIFQGQRDAQFVVSTNGKVRYRLMLYDSDTRDPTHISFSIKGTAGQVRKYFEQEKGGSVEFSQHGKKIMLHDEAKLSSLRLDHFPIRVRSLAARPMVCQLCVFDAPDNSIKYRFSKRTTAERTLLEARSRFSLDSKTNFGVFVDGAPTPLPRGQLIHDMGEFTQLWVIPVLSLTVLGSGQKLEYRCDATMADVRNALKLQFPDSFPVLPSGLELPADGLLKDSVREVHLVHRVVPLQIEVPEEDPFCLSFAAETPIVAVLDYVVQQRELGDVQLVDVDQELQDGAVAGDTSGHLRCEPKQSGEPFSVDAARPNLSLRQLAEFCESNPTHPEDLPTSYLSYFGIEILSNSIKLIFPPLPEFDESGDISFIRSRDFGSFAELCESVSSRPTDLNKLFCLFFWICHYVEYDLEAHIGSGSPAPSPDDVFASRKATSEGFCLTIREGCERSGVTFGIEIMSCYSKGYDWKPRTPPKAPTTNHTSLVVIIEGRKWLCDPTWGSGTLLDGEALSFNSEYNRSRFLVPLVCGLNDHFPMDGCESLLDEPLPFERFVRAAAYVPNEFVFRNESHPFSRFPCDGGYLKLQFSTATVVNRVVVQCCDARDGRDIDEGLHAVELFQKARDRLKF